MARLNYPFYARSDVVEMARDLLGKVIVTNIHGQITSGIIVETEAYNGRTDRACHAYGGRRTERTEVIYGPAGHAYIYLCYGIYSLFNIVTNVDGLADAVLVRAIEPLDGKEIIIERRNGSKNLGTGPGVVSLALGMHYSMSGLDLVNGDQIWLEGRGVEIGQIESSPRIGIDYAGEDALLPWRFNAIIKT